MTYEFEYLMHLVGVSALGLPFERPKQELCWKKLFDLASEQAVYALAASAAKPVWNVLEPELKQDVRARLYSVVVSEDIRQNAIWELIECFRSKDIPCALLKGMGLSALYKTPELRESGDVDLYVGKENEKRALSLLQQHGVSITKRNPTQHESAGYHSEIGPIELHAYLFREEDRKLWFGRSEKYTDDIDSFVSQEISENREIPVLAVQNNVEFLCLHFIKHFIREGISIRNILDVGLFLQAYENEIDHNRLWELLKSLGYDGIIQVALNICVHYFHMPEVRFANFSPLDLNTVLLVLNDIEQGGYFGAKEHCERSKSAQEYEKSVFGGSKWKRRRLFWERIYAAVPDKQKLQRKYSYAHKRAWLLPFAWLSYLASGSLKLLKQSIVKTQTEKELSQNGRIEMFKNLGIMK